MNDRTTTTEDVRAASTLEERLSDYRPESYHDFSDPDSEGAMRAAIERVAGELGRDYPARVGGEDVRLESTRASTDPGRPERVVGVFPSGGQALADRAIDAASRAFETWKSVPADQRAEIRTLVLGPQLVNSVGLSLLHRFCAPVSSPDEH